MLQVSPKPLLQQVFATSYLIREVERRLLELFTAGKLFGTVHTCIGQELVGVAVAQSLRPGDFLFSNHRCHGHFLARTGNVDGLIAEVMGKQTGVCGGRGGSQHLCDLQHGFFSNGIQGGIVPVAAGLAYSQQLRGNENIAVVFIGDGTLGEGAVYEALNIASKWVFAKHSAIANPRWRHTRKSLGVWHSLPADFDVGTREVTGCGGGVRCSCSERPKSDVIAGGYVSLDGALEKRR